MVEEKRLDELLTGKIYEKFGLSEDPFYIIPKQPLQSMVERDAEVEQAIIAIGNMRRGSSSHVALLGPHGVGKTHFLMALSEILQSPKAQEILGAKPVFIGGAIDFKQRAAEFLPTRGALQSVILFIDDMDLISNRYPDQTCELLENYRGSIVGTWDAHAWKRHTIGDNQRRPKADTILLSPLSLDASVKILKYRLTRSSFDRVLTFKLFHPDVLQKLAKMSNGNPYRLISRARRLMRFMERNGSSSVEAAFEKYHGTLESGNTSVLRSKFHTLSKRKKDVLGIVLDKMEISATELSQLTHLSRVWALHTLHELQTLGFLDNKRKGRRVNFYVHSEIQLDVSQWLHEDDTDYEKEETERAR